MIYSSSTIRAREARLLGFRTVLAISNILYFILRVRINRRDGDVSVIQDKFVDQSLSHPTTASSLIILLTKQINTLGHCILSFATTDLISS
jgi:hypothetical protein